MHGIDISVNTVGTRLDVILLSITGYIDTSSCQELENVINDLINKNYIQIIADLGGVTYVSSAGWGAFMSKLKTIRDQGGDIKIVQISQEVFEVFEMLEFDKILRHYDSIEEALNEFEILRGMDITSAGAVRNNRKEANPLIDYNPRVENLFEGGGDRIDSLTSEYQHKNLQLPLNEKIKRIVLENPMYSIRKICQRINSEEYGKEKIGWFRMRSLLKDLSLETKDKRYRFYRSR
ncbi:MAG: STAS domain-containing protein [bacterium]